MFEQKLFEKKVCDQHAGTFRLNKIQVKFANIEIRTHSDMRSADFRGLTAF